MPLMKFEYNKSDINTNIDYNCLIIISIVKSLLVVCLYFQLITELISQVMIKADMGYH